VNNEENICEFESSEKQSIGIWSDPRSWKIQNEEYYSKWFLEELQKIKLMVINFIKEGYLRGDYPPYGYSFLRRMAFYIAEGNNILDAIFRVNGLKGKIGLEYASAQIKIIYKKTGRIPRTRDEGMRSISAAVQDDYWKEYGIVPWNDFIKYCLGEDYYNLEKKREFDLAVATLKELNEKIQQLPISTSEETRWIDHKAKNGAWKEFGINSWNELLIHIFGKVNYLRKKYFGKEGLKTAKIEILEFFEKHGRRPKIVEFAGVRRIISGGKWKDFGISSWYDLLLHVFKGINDEIIRDVIIRDIISKGCNLEKIQDILRKIRDLHQRLPVTKDKGISRIKKAINEGRLEKHNIHSWNDLLYSTFWEVNVEYNDSEREKQVLKRRKKELESVIQELRKFKENFGRLPTNTDKDYANFGNNAKRGVWTSLGINSWNDLLVRAFEKVNMIRGKYVGKIGLKNAVDTLKEFKRKNNRLPNSRDEGMASIYTAIYRKEWIEFGIRKWNDLLFYVFKRVNMKHDSSK
jgi:hypothetical protein